MTINEIMSSGPIHQFDDGRHFIWERNDEGDMTGRLVCYPESAVREDGSVDSSKAMPLDEDEA